MVVKQRAYCGFESVPCGHGHGHVPCGHGNWGSDGSDVTDQAPVASRSLDGIRVIADLAAPRSKVVQTQMHRLKTRKLVSLQMGVLRGSGLENQAASKIKRPKESSGPRF